MPGSIDIEMPAFTNNDPLNLASKRVPEADIQKIEANTLRKRHKLKDFYKAQNEHIDRLTKTVDDHVEEARLQQGNELLHYRIAQHGSLAMNICLAILQIWAAVGGDSYSVFATAADAIFDPLSNANLYFWNRVMNKIDKDKYPGGKSRFENVGNIIFCWIMTAVSAILIAISALQISQNVAKEKRGEPIDEATTINWHSVGVLCTSIVIKTALFFICMPLRKRYTQIHTLYTDHRNDVLINAFGLFTSVAGTKIQWWIDPMGAILISVVIIILWAFESKEHFQHLVGIGCDRWFMQHVTYIALTHSPEDIIAVDTVRAWHSGPRLVVEVDIVMDPERSLRDAHDVAEDLQMKLERLPDVERAWVHIDYETTHAPEHFLKKVL